MQLVLLAILEIPRLAGTILLIAEIEEATVGKEARRVGPLVGWIPGATLRTDVVVNRIGWWIDGSKEE